MQPGEVRTLTSACPTGKKAITGTYNLSGDGLEIDVFRPVFCVTAT